MKITTKNLQNILETSNLESKKILISALLKWKLILILSIIFSVVVLGISFLNQDKYFATIEFEQARYIENYFPQKTFLSKPLQNTSSLEAAIRNPSSNKKFLYEYCNNENIKTNLKSILKTLNFNYSNDLIKLSIVGNDRDQLEQCANAMYSDIVNMQEEITKIKIKKYQEQIDANKLKINYLLQSNSKKENKDYEKLEEIKILLNINYSVSEAINYIQNNTIKLVTPISVIKLDDQKYRFTIFKALLGFILAFILVTRKDLMEYLKQ